MKHNQASNIRFDIVPPAFSISNSSSLYTTNHLSNYKLVGFHDRLPANTSVSQFLERCNGNHKELIFSLI